MTNYVIKLNDKLWVYDIVYKFTIKFTYCQLVYGQQSVLPNVMDFFYLKIAIDKCLRDAKSLEFQINLLKIWTKPKVMLY